MTAKMMMTTMIVISSLLGLLLVFLSVLIVAAMVAKPAFCIRALTAGQKEVRPPVVVSLQRDHTANQTLSSAIVDMQMKDGD